MICITGGGTGGHLKIAKIIKDELVKNNQKVIFIGSTYGQDKMWFENDKDFEAVYFLDTQGVMNKKRIKKISYLLKIISKTLYVKKIFKKHNIKKVISVGGYSAAPASFAAIMFNKQLFIHEQNAVKGTLNKILTPFAKRVFLPFDDKCAYPIADIFFDNSRIRTNLNTIIFLGGSQGARAINNFAIKIAPILKQKNINIIHQTGKNDFEKIKNFYAQNNIKADVFDFDKNLIQKIKQADFAVSRAGASTLFELVANKLPTLFIPYPYAAGDHQYFNAKKLADKNLAFVLKENELNEEKFLNIIENINLKTISENLTVDKNGIKCIIKEILNY